MTHGVETALSVLGMFGGSRFGGSVAVLGVGPLGMCHLIKAKLLGAARIMATDLFPSRLALAQKFVAGLVVAVNETTSEERIARIREQTGGLGADIVLSCSGVPGTFIESLKMVRVGGVVVEAGTFVDMGPVTINPNSDICTRNVAVIGVGGETTASYLPSMRMMAANLKHMPFEEFFSQKFGLEQAQRAVELAQTNDAMKVVIAPNGSNP